ncbi:MAG: hypothetical protein QG620_16 [Patescibacteria group bacterium]|nr:hypothetical protein [Patescibacteria group bacterium]
MKPFKNNRQHHFTVATFLLTIFLTLGIFGAGRAEAANNYSIFPPTKVYNPQVWGTYPAKGESRVDGTGTGATIARRADHAELTGNYAGNNPDNSLIVYSRYTPVNTTGEFVLIHGDDSTSAWVYRTSDNSMRTIIRMKPSLGSSSYALGEVNELRWDYSGTHPYRLYFVGFNVPDSQAVGGEHVSTSFYYTDIDPVSGMQSQPVLIHDFSAEFPAGTYPGATIMNDVEGDSSNDSRYWAWQVMDTDRGAGYLPFAIITYDKETDMLVGRLQRNCSGVSGVCTIVSTPATTLPYLSRPNMVEISPAGTRVIVDWGRTYTGNRAADQGTVADGPKAFLKDFSDSHRIGADETHSGWAWGAGGEELFVSQNNRNDYIEASDINRHTTPLEANGIDRSDCAVITGNQYTCGIKIASYETFDEDRWSLGMHFGKIYDANKRGWAFMNTYDDSQSWGQNANFFLEIKDVDDSPRYWRVTPSWNTTYDYRSEGSGALDFQGNNIWMTANWNSGVSANKNEAFSVELPEDWYSRLTGEAIDTTAPLNPTGLSVR